MWTGGWSLWAPGWGRRKVLSVRSTMSSAGHPSPPWLFCSTPFPSSFINYISLTNHNCGQPRPPNVKPYTRNNVSWQHILETWWTPSKGSRWQSSGALVFLHCDRQTFLSQVTYRSHFRRTRCRKKHSQEEKAYPEYFHSAYRRAAWLHAEVCHNFPCKQHSALACGLSPLLGGARVKIDLQTLRIWHWEKKVLGPVEPWDGALSVHLKVRQQLWQLILALFLWHIPKMGLVSGCTC